MRTMKTEFTWLGSLLVSSGLLGGGFALAQGHSHQVQIEVRDGYRYIYANGIPNHDTGSFPNQGNPNTISAQEHTYRVTLTPELADDIAFIRPTFGVALNGIPFEPGTGEFWNRDRAAGWNFEALTGFIDLGIDHHNAHVQPTGAYHYHGVPTGLVSSSAVTHIGYGADGFPVYGPSGYTDANDPSSGVIDLQSSYRLKQGLRPDGPGGLYDGAFNSDFEYVAGSGDLDECNGRFGATPEYPEGIYHYYITETFPFIPRCVKGTPDESFRPPGGGPAGSPGRRPNGPPPHRRRPGGPPPNRMSPDRMPPGRMPPDRNSRGRGPGSSYELSFP